MGENEEKLVELKSESDEEFFEAESREVKKEVNLLRTGLVDISTTNFVKHTT